MPDIFGYLFLINSSCMGRARVARSIGEYIYPLVYILVGVKVSRQCLFVTVIMI